MDIQGKSVLVLGGAGLVGMAVCRELLEHRPGRLVVAARRKAKASVAVEKLGADHPRTTTDIVACWGDIFIRADWQGDCGDLTPRTAALADPLKRRRLIADILDPLDEDILQGSLLVQLIAGTYAGPEGRAADIVIDCMNTATAVSYQNVYAVAKRLAALASEDSNGADWGKELEGLEEWDEAFEAFSRGAAARRKTIEFDEASEIAMYEAFGEVFTWSAPHGSRTLCRPSVN